MNKGKRQALNESWFTEHVFPSLPFQLTSNAGEDVQQMNKIQGCAENKRGTMAHQRFWQTVGRQKADGIAVLITGSSGSNSLSSKGQKGHDGHFSWGGEGMGKGMRWGSWPLSPPLPRELSFLRWCWCYSVKPQYLKLKLTSDHAPFTLTKPIVSLLVLSTRGRVCSTVEEVHTSSLLNHLQCPVITRTAQDHQTLEKTNNIKRWAKMFKKIPHTHTEKLTQ